MPGNSCWQPPVKCSKKFGRYFNLARTHIQINLQLAHIHAAQSHDNSSHAKYTKAPSDRFQKVEKFYFII